MNKIKIKSVIKILACVALLAIPTSWSEARDKETIVLAGDSDFAPFSFMEKVSTYADSILVKTERASGFSVDLVNMLSGTLEKDIRFKLIDPEKIPEELHSGRIDGFVTTLSVDEEDIELEMTRPVFELEYLIFVLKDNDFAKSMDSLKGTMVSVYNNCAVLEEIYKYRDMDIHLEKSLLRALRNLNEKKVTAVIAEQKAASFLIKRHNLSNIKAASSEAVFHHPYSLAINADNELLTRRIELGLTALQNDQTIELLARKWFSLSPPQPFPWKMVIFLTAGTTLLILILSGLLWVLSLNATVKIKTRQIELMSKKMIEKDKLAVLGKLAGQIAHELRTPLSIIHNSIFLLRREGSKDKGLFEKRLKLLEEKVLLSSNILESILSYSRVKAEVPSTISVKKCVETVLKDIELSPSLELTTDFAENGKDLIIYMDFHQLYSVLRNLFTNAIQAMRGEGKLAISGYTSRNNTIVNIKICDTAGGVPLPLRDKIFDLFYSSKITGTGLGLPISKSIVEAHNGKLYLAHSDNIGSCFMIELPKMKMDADEK